MPSPHPANLESGLSFLGPGTRLEGALRFSGRESRKRPPS